jgi:hypothetical protein
MQLDLPAKKQSNLLPLLVALNKPFYGSIVGSLHLRSEKTGGQLSELPVIFYAFATDALFRARFVGTRALLFVFL